MAVTVKELDELLKQLLKLGEEKDALEDLLTAKNKEISAIEWRAAAYLEELERTEYHTHLGKFTIEASERINLPKEDRDKQALFAHLRERGIADKYLTVHAGSLNALFFADREAFIESGGDPMLFAMPGIGPVKFANMPKFKPVKKPKGTT